MPSTENHRAGVALLVGIGAYQRADKLVSLRYAARDAEALAEVLTDPPLCGFPRDRVVLLTDGNARREDVVHRLSKWLPENARGARLVLVYFACHGAVQRVGQREEGFLLTHDADPDDLVTRGVAMSDVARWVEGIDAGAVVVCLDCCHAGKVVSNRAVHPGSEPVFRDMRIRPALLQGLSGRGRYLIASCDEGQTSVEAEQWGHGLFTYHLLRGLRGEGDRDGDGRVGVAELFEYVASAVEADAKVCGAEQRPWYSAVGPGGVYLSTPDCRADVTTLRFHPAAERLWREAGPVAAVTEIELAIPDSGEDALLGMLELLHRMRDPAGVPSLFRLLAHSAEPVRRRAKQVLHAFGWEHATAAVEELARGPSREKIASVLDGLAAFESHREVVALLDRLVCLLKGDLRNRSILLLEKKRLGLEVDRIAEVFREIRSPYTIRKALGQGLFTAALLARDDENDLDVVVRVLRPEFASQPHLRARFLDLARQSVRFVHQNLVLTREVRSFPDLNLYYAVRDHVEGPTLQRRLETAKAFDQYQSFDILRQLLGALYSVHSASAVHGGFKPSNIFLPRLDRVVLGDVSPPIQGTMVALDRLSYDYRYAAPEGFRGKGELGPSSDLYSLGCVAYELVVGRPPFVSDNPYELVIKHDREDVVFPSQLGCLLHPAAEAFILRLLAKSPADRFSSVSDALLALAAVPQATEITWELQRKICDIVYSSDSRESHDEDLNSIVVFSSLGGDDTSSVLHTDQFGSQGDPRTLSEASDTGSPARADSDLQTPRSIGRYNLLDVLGRGGMGVVYKAYDESLGRLVAIKMVLGVSSDEPKQRTRFKREAMALANLQHPNIVQIYDVSEQDGNVYFVLELVQGGSLSSLIQGKPMPSREVAKLISMLARAIHFAHRQGIIHRDLKPSNILLSADGVPKITDFGLARHTNDDVAITRSGEIIGTPAYMSPEQAGGETVGPATDIFSLGVIFYQLLSGRRPFRAERAMQIMYETIHSTPAPPSHVNSDIPRELDSICMKCLNKDPINRYSTAEALADDLDRYLAGDAILAARPSLWRRLFWRFSSRK